MSYSSLVDRITGRALARLAEADYSRGSGTSSTTGSSAARVNLSGALQNAAIAFSRSHVRMDAALSAVGVTKDSLSKLLDVIDELMECASSASKSRLSGLEQRFKKAIKEFKEILATAESNGVDLLAKDSLVEVLGRAGIDVEAAGELADIFKRLASGDGTIGYSEVEVDDVRYQDRTWRKSHTRGFNAPAAYSTGPQPDSIATADLNGDNAPDIITANPGSNSVSVLLSNSDGTLRPKTDYAVGIGPSAIAVGDLNGDRHADVVTANYGEGRVSVLLGNGDGSLGPASAFAIGTGPVSIQLGDVNGDEVLDIVAGSGGESVPEIHYCRDFTDSDVDISSDSATISRHGLNTGDRVRLSTTDTLPDSLSSNVNYYVIKVDDNTIKFASSPEDAQANTAVDITTIGSGTHTIDFGPLMSDSLVCEPLTVDEAADLVTTSKDIIKTGDKISLTCSDAPGGLTNEGIYYAYRAAAGRIGFAASLANAQAGVLVDITSSGSGMMVINTIAGIGDQTFSTVDTVNDAISIAGHGYFTGDLVQLTSTDSLPGGLSSYGKYYVIRIDSGTIKLAASYSEAQAGIAIDLSSTGAGTHTMLGAGASIDPSKTGVEQGASLTASFIDAADDQITLSGHGCSTGQRVQFFSTDVLPGGLAEATDYYVVKIDSDRLKLAASLANAQAGVTLDLTSAGSGTLTIVPLLDKTIVPPAAVDISSGTFTSAGHDYITGDRVRLSTTGNLPGDLFPDTDYYVIKVDRDRFKLASSAADAQSGISVDLTSQGTGLHTVDLAAIKNGAAYAITQYEGDDTISLTYSTAAGDLIAEPYNPATTLNLPRGDGRNLNPDTDYFKFETVSGEYYVRFTIDGAGADPNPGGIPVTVPLTSEMTHEEVVSTTIAELQLAVPDAAFAAHPTLSDTLVITDGSTGERVDITSFGAGITVSCQAQGSASSVEVSHVALPTTLAHEHQSITFAAGNQLGSYGTDSLPDLGFVTESGTLHEFYYQVDGMGGTIETATAHNISVNSSDTAEEVAGKAVDVIAASIDAAIGYTPENVSITENLFTLAGHSYQTGDAVRVVGAAGGSLPAPLSSGARYYVYRADSDHIGLAASYADAQSGTLIDITSMGSGRMFFEYIAPARPLTGSEGDTGLLSVAYGLGDGTFEAPEGISSIEWGRLVGLTDLNNDKKLDLVTINGAGNSIRVSLGGGAPSEYASGGSQLSSAAFADFDNDGDIDIVTANTGSNSFSYFAGNGDGTFSDGVTGSMGSAPKGIFAGDLDKDGSMDLAAAGSGGNTVTVRFGNGDGSFQAPVAFTVGSAPSSVTFADLNADGFQEMISLLTAGDRVAVNTASIDRTSATVSKIMRGGDGIDPLAQSVRTRGRAKFALETLKKLKADVSEDLKTVGEIDESLRSARSFAMAGLQASEELAERISSYRDAESLARSLTAAIRKMLPSELAETHSKLDLELAKELLL